jgi:viologen exporter family transport system permease protein
MALRCFGRAWHVAFSIARVTFRAQLEYRADFLLSIGVGMVWQTAIIIFASVLLTRFRGMAGWPADAVLLIVGVRMLGHGLFLFFFGRVLTLTHLVQNGQIDGFLLRPMPVYRQVQLSQFPANSIGDLLVGLTLFAAAAWRLDSSWTVFKAVYLAAAVAGATLTEGAIFTAVSAATLHYPVAHAWTKWLAELMETFGNYPLRILPGLAQAAFTWILPLAFAAYFPVAALTGRAQGLGAPEILVAASPCAGLVLYVMSRLAWNASLRRYSGTGG